MSGAGCLKHNILEGNVQLFILAERKLLNLRHSHGLRSIYRTVGLPGKENSGVINDALALRAQSGRHCRFV